MPIQNKKNYLLSKAAGHASVLTVLLLIFSAETFAQKSLTIEDAVMGREAATMRSLAPKNLSQLQWLPSGKKVSYVQNNRLVIFDTETSAHDSSLTLDALNKANALLLGKNYTAMKTFPQMTWVDYSNFRYQSGGTFVNYNVAAGVASKLNSIDEKAVSVEYHHKSNNIAYTKDNNIYISTASGVKQVTADGGKGLVYGETVHRNEFGINKGLFWSNDGKKLAFYRMDESMVTDYAIYDTKQVPATTYTIKYPTAGSKSHHVTIGVYDLESGKTIYLQTGEPREQYLTNVTWGPDNRDIYVAVVNRGQNQMMLNRYNASEGFMDIMLFEERHDKYVEPEHGPVFLPSDPGKFIWQSERDGFNHMYLYNTEGKMLTQLTQGKWLVTEVLGFNQTADKVFFESTKESPLERHLYSVSISGGAVTKITADAGTHIMTPNADCSLFIDHLSSTEVPRRISIQGETGYPLAVLLNAPNPLDGYTMGETALFPIVNDNTVLYCRMISPPGFDAQKKYPVIVYLYGGPHAQMNTNTWLGGSNLWMQFLAQQGYIVFTLDNRGSDFRGLEFENATFRQLGTLEMQDQLAGVEYLKKLSYIDANRIAIHGWSFGGFMTTTMMTRAPGVFKVGVAGGPVIDWKLYEIMYTERYMDTPEENPDGYKKANLLNYIGDLEDKLLMIHGCDDDVVLWQHSLLYSKAAVDNGNINLDYFVYPGHKHNVRGKDRVHLMKKITQYIFENL